MSQAEFVIERGGPRTIVTLNRPDDGNRVTLGMAAGLVEALRAIAPDPEHRVVVLRGAGEHFCLGRAETPHEGRLPPPLVVRMFGAEPILALYRAIADVPVPVVAAVRGDAHGLGCALAGACDLVFASSAATFALPEIDNDVPPLLALTSLVSRVGRRRLEELAYLPEPWSAERAHLAGLVSHVVPDEVFEQALERSLAHLERASAVTLATVKRFLEHTRQLGTDATSDLAANTLATVISSR